MIKVERYGRWIKEFDVKKKIDRVEFIAPDGSTETRPTYLHQPAELVYDHHGYETVQAKGNPVLAVRFTPEIVGTYRYRALSGEEVVEKGEFVCVKSDNHGFVEISKKDPRYFAFSDGTPYCPIGLNLCTPPYYRLPSGGEATLGVNEYRRWFSELALNGGNYTRLWLGSKYFNTETEIAGELDLAAFAKLDAVVELARKYGIRLKLCLEHFRAIGPFKQAWASKIIKHPEDGRSPKDTAEWFLEEEWRELWLKKVRAYTARYGDDPVVMAWELWNEINCCQTGDWRIQRDWTRDMLPRVKALSPKNLVVNSVGSYDSEKWTVFYEDFKMDEMDFQQVHRYLDQGAPLKICRLDPVALTVDAIPRARRPDKPVILAETGAVNDNHTGVFRFCRMDHRGIILHDTTFPAFFAGAAGPGHEWWWDSYVEAKNLWWAYKPFADLIKDVQLDEEDFRTADLSSKEAWFLCLVGKNHLLGWVRNKSDSWHAVLRDQKEPDLLTNLEFDLTSLGIRQGEVTTIYPWKESKEQAQLVNGRLKLPPFRYGLMIKIKLKRPD